jgi:CubicO group peptidase (beta-lactamase class C family)
MWTHSELLRAASTASLLLAVFQPLRAGETIPGPENPAEVEEFIDQFFHEKMAERHVPGAVFVLVKNGRILLAKGYGYADLEREAPVIPDKTVFQVASVTKLFTATAVMQLYERGQLRLEDDVNRYLKTFQLYEPFPRPVTVANLLTHTGGFDERMIGMSARSRAELRPLASYLAARMPACTLPPGDVISYSNHGIALAGYLVEEISGMPFARYMDENLLGPLQMRHSSYEPDAEFERQEAVSYRYDKDLDRFNIADMPYPNDGPAGALVATGTDMAAFIIAHLQDGRYGSARILKQDTAREMQRQHFTQHPKLPGCTYGFWEGSRNGRRWLGHGGDWSGFASLLFLMPAEGVGFFVSHNADDWKLRDDLVKAFMDRYYPAPSPAPRAVPPADFVRRAGLFAGSYRYNRYARRTLEKLISSVQVQVTDGHDGTLTIEIPALLKDLVKPIRLVETEPLLFAREDGDGYAAFRMDSEGHITHLALSALGLPVVLEKVPWYETTAVQGGLAIAFLIVFGSACMAWLSGCVVRLWRRTPPGAKPERFISRLAIVVSFLNLLFVGGLVALVLFGDLAYGMPRTGAALLGLPLVAAVLTAVLVVASIRMWREGAGTALRRCYVSLVALAAVGFLVVLDFWSLFGFRY